MERKYAKVEGNSTLVRDLHTGAIINIDEGGYRAYIAQKTAAERRREEVEQLKQEVSSIKNDMSEIKNLLHQLLSK
jgi:polyhydroxyalkanoate synthesis regulator phasin